MSPAKLALMLFLALSLPRARAQQPTFATSLLESSSLEGSAESVVNNAAPKKHAPSYKPFTALAVAFNSGTLGAGVELATPLSRSFNLRVGGDLVSFTYPFSLDGFNYATNLHLHSGRLSLDWFPLHGSFHVSPGIFYANNYGTALASVPPGQTFTLGDQSLINTVDDPIGGTASIGYPRRLAPMLTMGFGNMIPRSGHHLTIPVEFGAAFTGQPHMNVELHGTACTTEGCFDAAIDPTTQQNLKAEIARLNSNLAKLTVYPILTVGLAYRF